MPLRPALLPPLLCLLLSAVARPAGLPEFRAPGHEAAMARLTELYALHFPRARTRCTLWDGWLPRATLWAAAGDPPSAQDRRDYYRAALLEKRIDAEGHVSMQQHRGMAHSEGWPFPAWQQAAGGRGFHFSTRRDTWAEKHFHLRPLESAEGWDLEGLRVEGVDPARGLRLTVTGETARLTTPAFACGTIVAPFIRLEWSATGLPAGAGASLAWKLREEPAWTPGRAVPLALPGPAPEYENLPLYRQPGYAGLLERLRIELTAARGAEILLKGINTAVDSRHPVTNALYLQGCDDYFAWTTDLPFLRENIGRMRRALDYALDEFGLRKHRHVVVPWVGHDGRSGLEERPDGTREARPGWGVGNNYWDLLPFGGHDAYATTHLLDALRRMNRLEGIIASRPDWQVPPRPTAEREEQARLADDIAREAAAFFWNADTGRFIGWQDSEGRRVDYGFTFVNLEAIHAGLATPEQARSIFDWLDGRRVVAGDTSTGADLYQWRFAPRATTRRNTIDYVWLWLSPQSIPWGGQVQDGGAVLGFSHFDLMARLKVNGPDDAWRRLLDIATWFDEVQRAGGYRSYYRDGSRGTLQGGGTAGGLGLDEEFLESILATQVMVDGFLGLEPVPGGLRLRPRLPSSVSELTVTRVQAHGHVLDITARPDSVEVRPLRVDGSDFLLALGDNPLRPYRLHTGQAVCISGEK